MVLKQSKKKIKKFDKTTKTVKFFWNFVIFLRNFFLFLIKTKNWKNSLMLLNFFVFWEFVLKFKKKNF